jgi:predicted nucleic-acid-binding protein
MRAIDTNVLVRLLARDDPAQITAADAFVAPGAWVSHLVLAQTLWVLDSVYQRTAVQLASAIEMLLSHRTLVLQDAETVTAALASFRNLATTTWTLDDHRFTIGEWTTKPI